MRESQSITGKLLDQAMELRRLGRYEELLDCYDHLFERTPMIQWKMKALQHKMLLLDYLGRYNEAIEVCDKGLFFNHQYFLQEKERVIMKRDKEKAKRKKGGKGTDIKRKKKSIQRQTSS